MHWRDHTTCARHIITCNDYAPFPGDFDRFRCIVPGIPEGIAITTSREESVALSDEEFAKLQAQAPWFFLEEFCVYTHRIDAMYATDYCALKLKSKHRTSQAEWLRDALDRMVSQMACAIRPSSLAKGRSVYLFNLRHTAYRTFCWLAARRFGFDPYCITGDDIELQLIMWLKPFVDWHKEWVKLGRPLNLDEG